MRKQFSIVVLLLFLAACGAERNQAPTAQLSASATSVDVGQQVTIDGSASSDPDGDPLLFRWSLDAPEASSVELVDTRAETITLTPDVAGTYTVHLTVDDGEFESPGASVDIEVAGTGTPTADAGQDQTVDVGDQVQLDGSGSQDPEGDALTYQWSFQQKPQGSNASLSDPNAETPTFTADVGGDYIVGLVVSDGTNDSAMDRVTISAGGGNQPPVADAGADITDASVGTEVVLDGSASTDPDSASLTYFWSFVSKPATSNAALSDATTENARFTPDAAGDYVVELEVSDGDNVDTDTVSVSAELSVTSTCLLISEYIEGSSYNKAIELYNCDSSTIDLSNFGLCLITNDSTTCDTYDFKLSGTLDAGNVVKLCSSRLDATVYDPANCDIVDSTLDYFNGDDRIIVYEDTDDSGGHNATDLPADVFGEPASRPSNQSIWKDVTLRRCNFDRFDGTSGFDFTNYYTASDTIDDFSDFGTPPNEGCN